MAAAAVVAALLGPADLGQMAMSVQIGPCQVLAVFDAAGAAVLYYATCDECAWFRFDLDSAATMMLAADEHAYSHDR
jgi:hypothetical protein